MRYFDLHCDTPYECFNRGITTDNGMLAASVNKGEYLKEWHQCFAVWIKDDARDPFALYGDILNNFKEKLSLNKPMNLTPHFTLEGGAVLENDIDRLDALKKDGIKAITLSWNGKNNIASGAYETGGLTDFGKRVIGRMNELKIATDLSHLNRESFFDALPLARYPVATHSCLCELNKHPRNLSKEQVRALCSAGGIIGLCFYPEFLGSGSVFENIYKNIAILLDTGFEDSIAFGSDFDGADMCGELDGVDKIKGLYDFLHQKGMEKALLEKIFYYNAYNFFLSL